MIFCEKKIILEIVRVTNKKLPILLKLQRKFRHRKIGAIKYKTYLQLTIPSK